ncbi:MAG: hypothetical protein FWG33_01735 [Oscillospiraceae bacterium]|nr:hypothetical protein [Oscillospiraceae bacterium]
MSHLLQAAAVAEATPGPRAGVSFFSALIFIPALLFIIAGMVVLQIYLSKRDNKWLGLILPFIGIGVSLTAILGTVFFTSPGSTVISYDEYGNVIHEETIKELFHIDPATIIMTIVNFLLFNIPSIILLLIYFACRESVKRRTALESENHHKEIDKMNIQDLE